jgi:hypothetical protein
MKRTGSFRPRPVANLTTAAAILLDFVRAGVAAAAEISRDAAPGWSALVQRRPPGFDWSTFERLVAALRNLAHQVPQLIQFVRHQHQVLGHGGALMVLLAIALGYGIFGRARLARRFADALALLSRRIPGAAREWLAALCDIVAAALLPALLWLLWAAVRAITAFTGPVFIIAGQLLSAWTVYAVAIGAAYALVRRPLLAIAPGHGRYLFRIRAPADRLCNRGAALHQSDGAVWRARRRCRAGRHCPAAVADRDVGRSHGAPPRGTGAFSRYS